MSAEKPDFIQGKREVEANKALKGVNSKGDKQKKLAEALKENLSRRKQQKRNKKDTLI